MHSSTFLFPIFALMFSDAIAQLRIVGTNLFSCSVTKYPGTFYKIDNMLGDKFRPSATFEECVEICLLKGGCTAVNFIAPQQLCGVLSSGILDGNADESVYDQWDDSVHAMINCPPQKASKPVGCGRQASAYSPSINSRNRIIGGAEAKPNSWPWLVTLNIDMRNGFGAKCGSTLLRVSDIVEASDILLTAAHCVTSEQSQGTYPQAFAPDQVEATAGNHRLNRYDVGEQTRTGAEIRFHKDFRFTRSTGANNDVALIKLDQLIAFSDTIRPICLPNPGEAIPVGKTCVAAGWGRNNSQRVDESPTALQQVLAPAQDEATCKKGWGQTYKVDQMICAGSLTGTSGTCQGDSGGMLACQQADGGWRVYGATSFGVSGTCLEAGRPSNFARVSSYVDWIKKNMNEMTSLL